MKKTLLTMLALAVLMAGNSISFAAENTASEQDKAGIEAALNNYIQAAIKGDSKIAAQSFAPRATMSWSEDGKLKTVPISELYAYFDKTDPHNAYYTIDTLKVAGNVALVGIDSRFGDVKFDDMFTLVKDGDEWKIVSKVYNVKP